MADKKEAKKKLTTAKRKCTRLSGHFADCVKVKDQEGAVESFGDLDAAFRDLESKHDQYMIHLDSDDQDEKEEIHRQNEDMDLRYKEYSKNRSEARTMQNNFDKKGGPPMMPHYPGGGNESIKVKRLDAPKFTGTMREYPSFKREYQSIMVRTYGEDPYALKSCLGGDALKLVGGVDGDYVEMFRRLDAKYGKAEKLADVTLNDIRGLKRLNDGESLKFIAMVDLVEKSWLDLKQMEMEGEMNNTTMISQIEKLLPPIQRREWAIRRQRAPNTPFQERFKEFLKFLLEEKEAMEYMQDAVRQCGPKNVVTYTYEKEAERDDLEGNVASINLLKQQVQDNQDALRKVVQGLAQVTQVLSSRDGERNVAFKQRSCWYCKNDHHEIEECASFIDLPLNSKTGVVKSRGACFTCLRLGHISRNCFNRKTCGVVLEDNKKCDKFHHPILHATWKEGGSSNVQGLHVDDRTMRDRNVLLMISCVACRGIPVTTLWDPGANISLIRHAEAEKLGLKGEKINLTITKVGNITETIQSKRYILPLTDNYGKVWKLSVYGMDELTADSRDIDVSEAAKLFTGIHEEDIQRPIGKVSLLIGTDYCQLFPVKVQENRNLQLMRNDFGYCLRGSHPTTEDSKVVHNVLINVMISKVCVDAESSRIELASGIKEQLDTLFEVNSTVMRQSHKNGSEDKRENLGTGWYPQCGGCRCGKCVLRSSLFTITSGVKERLDRLFEVNSTVMRQSHKDGLEDKMKLFFEIENLGTGCYPQCGGCRCGKCALGSSSFTLKEERELAMIENGLKYDPITKTFTVIYPWIRNPYDLPNNYPAAKGRLLSTQKRLMKMGDEYLQLYEEQVFDMVERGVARKLTSDERRNYKGPIHYLPHHEILKLSSKSTPLRIVFDPSASFMGHILNNYWAKGPSMINDLIGVLLRFRQDFYGLIGDISKMYNTIKLSEFDQHVHRFLWKDARSDTEPDHYMLLKVTFGDRPSGTISMLALKKTAVMQKEDHPKESQMIIRNTYVDDLINSLGSKSECDHAAYTIDQILQAGGFKVKGWTITGSGNINHELDTSDSIGSRPIKILENEEEKILGMVLDVQGDYFKFVVKIDLTPKVKGRKSKDDASDLTKEDIYSNVPEVLTRRMVLSQIARIYDPLGLVIPMTLKAKVLMRQLTIEMNHGGKEGASKWDEPLSDDTKDEWMQFFYELFDLEVLKFPRCIKPTNAVGNPMLIVFSDASNTAYGAVAYIRWETSEMDQYESYLICSKNRIAPSKQMTVPRLELCGAVLASRLREKIVTEMDVQFGSIIHITDSAIVQHQIQKESYGFASFVATRVGEIQVKTNPSEWWWTNSDNNPADMVTRISKVESLGEKSVWQRGPDYLRYPFESWPISKECTTQAKELPDRIGVVMSVDKSSEDPSLGVNLKIFNLKYFRSYYILLRATALVVLALKKKTFCHISNDVTVQDIDEAERLWIMHTQKRIPSDWVKRYKRLGPSLTSEGIIVVGKRMDNWLQKSWNNKSIALLPPKDEFTKLYLLAMHNECHEGIEATLLKTRMKFWIPGARRIIRCIKRSCTFCRLKERSIIGQEMGRLPTERLEPSPPFYNCAVDLFGPFEIRDSVKKRCRGKGYGVLFNCLSSRAVYIDLASGYDTDSFLIVLRRFVSVRGYPRTMISDLGSQLVGAANELQEITKSWDVKQIAHFGQINGMEWKTIRSADAPWENGCSEALIKVTKRNIRNSIGTHVLTFPELQTVLFEISNILNERPIGTTSGDPNDGSYCCPNNLILGRATIRVPPGVWDTEANVKKRWEFIQIIVNAFWKTWMHKYFHTLIIRNKWHTAKRNLQCGDVVLVQDSNAIRGEWKLAQVSEANPGSDGKVRDVTLRYKIQDTGTSYKGNLDKLIKRSAHRLVLVLPVEEQSN